MCPYVTSSTSSKPSRKVCIIPFLRGLLNDPTKRDIICWTDESKQEFRFLDNKKVAALWGATKPGRKVPVMTYDVMARSLREFVKANKLEKMEGKNCGYRFVKPPAFGIGRILSDEFGNCSWFPPSADNKLLDVPGFNGIPSAPSGNFYGIPILTPSPTPSPLVKSKPSSGTPSPVPSTSSGVFTGSQTPNPTPSPVVMSSYEFLAIIATMTPKKIQEVIQIVQAAQKLIKNKEN